MDIVKINELVLYRRQDNSLEVYKCVDTNYASESVTIQRKVQGKNNVFTSTFRARTKQDTGVRICRCWIQPHDEGVWDNLSVRVLDVTSTDYLEPVVSFEMAGGKKQTQYLSQFAKTFSFKRE